MDPQPRPGDPQPRPGWWKRNWKWFVPVSLGCLLLFGGAIIALIVTMVMGSVKSSVPYTRALAQAKTDPTLIAEMGSPIEAGWYVTGSISSTGANSYANFYIPIHGPNKSGTLHVIALKSSLVEGMEDWKINVLEAKIEGRSEPIGLLSDERANSPQAVTPSDSDVNESAKSDGPPGTVASEVAPVGAGSGTGKGVPGVAPGVPGAIPGGVQDVPPPPPPSSALPKVISGGVLNGKAISLPKPAYPAIARSAGASGSVIVQVLVDENGKVVSATAVSGHTLLRAAAVVAARQARFTPTKLSGQAVKVSGVITYNFSSQ